MGLLERIRGRLGMGSPQSVPAMPRPNSAYFHNEMNPFLFGFAPQLREHQEDVRAAWEKSAARAITAIQNSGFLSGIVETASGSVVGSGLRMAARPDGDVLGWKKEQTREFTRNAEARFRAWARNPIRCDAGGTLTFSQMQQAAFASYLAYGEIFALLPMFSRTNVIGVSRVKLLPPTRISSQTDLVGNVIQGVKVDEWGMPVAYKVRRKNSSPWMGWDDVSVPTRNDRGRPNLIHIKDPAIATTRGISPFAAILKTYRQVDQYFDANMTSALLQTIFAATIKTNISGQAAYDGLMTDADNKFDPTGFGVTKGEWYDGAKIDLSQHGRIAHLFPGDELEFNEAKTPAQQFDAFMGWLMREVSRGTGVTYESATGDYRGATYSSVRMAGAVEWLTVKRRRDNIIVPFCEAVYSVWLDEEIATKRLAYPGGYPAFERERDFAIRSNWTGPARPQADDFKTARAYEVRKGMFATTLAEISEEYGQDWDDVARQQAAENDFYKELGLPKPWAAKDLLEVEGGEDASLKAAEGNDPEEKPGKKKGASERPPGERDPAEAIEEDLEPALEDGAVKGDGDGD